MLRGDHQTDPAKALVWYQVAATLAPHNPLILEKLATSDLQNGRDDDALRAATRSIAHGAGSRGYVLKSQALLELGRSADAIKTAKTATNQTPMTCKPGIPDCAHLQLGLAYAASGDNVRLSALIGLPGASRAAHTLSEVQHNHLGLAQELYVLGLPRSAQRVLAKYQVESSQFYLLQAHITLDLGHNSKTALEQGRGLLEKAVVLSPERVDLRQDLQAIDQKLGDTAAATEQGSKIQALQSGKV